MHLLLGTLMLLVVVILLRSKSRRIIVCVLGDVGRSPRMVNHCLSLTRLGYSVDFIAYKESEPIINPNIRIHYLAKPKKTKGIAQGLFRILVQSLQLFWIVIWLPPPAFILVQVF
jgi:beta-1,4-mannosyltransferase